MKTTHATPTGSRLSCTVPTLIIRGLLLNALLLTSLPMFLQAQETVYTRPSWMFGVAAGLTANFYRGSTQTLTVSMQIGAGIDLPFSSNSRRTQVILSPFVSYHPYFTQGSTAIPNRYVMLKKTPVKSFKDDQPERPDEQTFAIIAINHTYEWMM